MTEALDPNVRLKFIRLTSGEDLITEYQPVKDEEGDYYILQNPMKVLYMAKPDQPNRISVSLMNWVFPNICEDEHFIIHPNDVMTMGKPAKAIAEYYYELIRGDEVAVIREPTDEELKEIENEEEALQPVSDEEMDEIKDFLRKTPAEKKRLLH